MVFVLISNIDKDEWRGTNSAINIITFISRILTFIWLDPDELHLHDVWLQCVCVMASGVASLSIGNAIATRVSQATFRDLLLVFLFCGGLSLLTAGMGNFSVIVVALGMVGICVFGFIYRRLCDQNSI